MSKHEIEIAFLINSFNRLELLKGALQSLLWVPKSKFKDNCSIIIFDAGSTDGTIEWLCDLKLKYEIPIEIINPKQGEDTSFAAGLNACASLAIKRYENLKYFIFYETDNQILNSSAVEQAITELTNRNKLAACGFTVRKHNGDRAGVGTPFPKLINFALGKNIVHKFNLETISYKWEKGESGTDFSLVDVVYTSPLVVKVESWKQSGGLDTIAFPFSDCDIDWSKRLNILGWQMGVIKTEDVIHDNLDYISSWSKTRAIQFHRARLLYFKKYKALTIYMIYPFALIIRHLCEFMVAKFIIRDPIKRQNLSNQFFYLIKSALKGYY